MIDAATFKRMLLSSARLLSENTDRLSEIDSRFGDGDHGVTIAKIASCIQRDTEAWDGESFHDFLEGLGDDIMGVNGGSAGPLYGTLIGGMAEVVDDRCEVDSGTLKAMLRSSLEELSTITTARVGDKTMMDALIPAVEAAEACEGDIPAVMQSAATAAAAGAEATGDMVSKYGRARSYGEQTIGTADAGAVSTALLIEGLAAALA